MRKIGIIDDDKNILGILKKIYEQKFNDVMVKMYHYPKDTPKYLEEAKDLDYILVDHRLGGTNGANVAALLMKDRDVKAKIYVITSHIQNEYRLFKYYFEKIELIKNPEIIFGIKDDIVDQAVETSVLMQIRV